MESESIRINLDAKTFDQFFEEKLPATKTYEQAYEAAEAEHEKLTGHNKYSDYDSFRNSRKRRMKNKKK